MKGYFNDCVVNFVVARKGCIDNSYIVSYIIIFVLLSYFQTSFIAFIFLCLDIYAFLFMEWSDTKVLDSLVFTSFIMTSTDTIWYVSYIFQIYKWSCDPLNPSVGALEEYLPQLSLIWCVNHTFVVGLFFLVYFFL